MPPLKKILRYFFFGSLGFLTNVAIFFVLIEYAHIWYVLSACISFAISVFVSFYLQSNWTFKGDKVKPIAHQIITFYVLSVVNVLVNGLLVFIFVEKCKTSHLVAVTVSSGLIAIYSFFVYKAFIFKTDTDAS